MPMVQMVLALFFAQILIDFVLNASTISSVIIYLTVTNFFDSDNKVAYTIAATLVVNFYLLHSLQA
jgi:hypothetical protein